jgi:non-ribosomal peptide synthetase component E (peptide arylation enzyme)
MTPRYPIAGVRYRSEEQVRLHLGTGAWLDSTGGEVLRAAARIVPDKLAVIAEDGTYSFRELDHRSESAAACLMQSGLRPGDRAVFQLGSVKEIFVALYACFKAGIVPLCTLPQYREIEIGELGRKVGAKAYFVQGDFSPSFDQLAFARRMSAEIPSVSHLIVARGDAGRDELSLEEISIRHRTERARAIIRPHDPAPEDVIQFQLSGGSTGLPKIIPRFHAEYLGSTAALAARYGYGGECDVGLWVLPLIHNAGMLFMVMPTALLRRTTVIQARFQIEEFVAAIARYKVTFSGSIGPVAARILEYRDINKFDLSSLKQFFALSRSDAVEAHLGITCGNMFGITEGLLLASSPNDPLVARHRSVGRPVAAGDKVSVLQPGSEQPVAFGEVGELCFSGPNTLTGYFDDPAANQVCFTADGFFRSGDLVRAVEIEGTVNYVFEGRLKDNINRGGEKIGAEELENLIVTHPAILDARAVAMPDRIYGEKVCAFVIARPGAAVPNVAELGAFLLQAGLAKFKLPERIEIVDAFPVTRVGKVDKAALRAQVAVKLAAEQAGERGQAASASAARFERMVP